MPFDTLPVRRRDPITRADLGERNKADDDWTEFGRAGDPGPQEHFTAADWDTGYRPWIVIANAGSDDEWTGTLVDFIAANRDGIDLDERLLIAETLAAGGEYRGGGGAAAEWTVRSA